MDTRVTGGVPKNFARKAKKIMVDIDKNELNKKRGLKIDLKIEENVNDFLDKISSKINLKITKKKWLEKCIEWKKIIQLSIRNTLMKKNMLTHMFLLTHYLKNYQKKKL